MFNFKMVKDVKVMAGTKAFEWLESKDPLDHKKAKLLMEFCDKAERIGYEYKALMQLREQYKDVL